MKITADSENELDEAIIEHEKNGCTLSHKTQTINGSWFAIIKESEEDETMSNTEHFLLVIDEHLILQRDMYLNKFVTVTTGKYKGRNAVVDDIIIDQYHGFRYLIMVFKIDSMQYLNSDRETRSYRIIDQFELVE